MILYNASTSDGLRNHSRFLTNTDTSTYSNADLDASINRYYRMFVNKIIEAMDGWDFQGEVATADIVANQQEYVFPTGLLKFKRAEVTYDGVTWRRVKLSDINSDPRPTDTTTTTRDYTTYNPHLDLFDQSIFLYPTPTGNVTAGLKIWYEKDVTDLSADTDEPLLLKAYQKGLSVGGAIDYQKKYREVEGNSAKLLDNQNDLDAIIDNMQNFYRRRTQDQEYYLEPRFVDYDYGNDY